MNANAVIFDLDGTLANCDHRLGYVTTKPKNWKAFFAGIPFDTVQQNVKDELTKNCVDNSIVIVTARPETTKTDTIAWLYKNNIEYDAIYFRKENDFRNDVIVKSEIYDRMIDYGYTPILVYDDKDNVLEMYKEKGIETIKCPII